MTKKDECLFNLQVFAEDGASEGSTEGAEQQPTGATTEIKESEGKQTAELKYTDEDVNRLIRQKHAEWNKKQEQKESEAARLAKMSAEEKTQERMNALEAKLHEYEAKETRNEMMTQARNLLHDKGFSVNDGIIASLISDDADTTKANVESFVALMKSEIEKGVNDKLKGSGAASTPKKGSASGMTAEQILSVANRAERQRLINENMHLFQ